MKRYLLSAVFVLLLWEIFSILPPWDEGGTGKRFSGRKYLYGIIHVHSTFSDGGGSPLEIAEAARKAGIDFVVLTDHMSSQARRSGFEKRYGETDLFVEMEAATWAGHCLTFFSQTEARQMSDAEINDLAWKHFRGEATKPGLFSVVAHPSNIKNPWTSLDRFPDGIEVINFDSFWQRELYQSMLGFLTTALLYPVNNYLAALRFFQIYRKDFSAWDAMNSVSRGHFGILAHDTHAKTKLNAQLHFHWPSYLKTFKLASNIIFLSAPLSKDFENRRKQIYQAIREGRTAMIFHSIYPFEGNDWRLICGKNEYVPGEDAPPDRENCFFKATSPQAFPYPKVFRLWRDGDLVEEVTTTSSTFETKLGRRGAYRLEVWAKIHTIFRLLLNRDVPYLFYNPIYVR